MNTFVIGTMTPVGTVLCFLIATTLVLMGAYSMISVATTLTPRAIYVGIAFLTFDVFMFYTVYEVSKAAYILDSPTTWLGKWFGNMEPAMRWALMIALLAAGALRMMWVQRTMRTTINQFSVSETLDLMPLGISFSNAYGQVMQTNEKMNDLSFELTGNVIVNENEFWDQLTSGEIYGGTLVESPDLSGMGFGVDQSGQPNQPSHLDSDHIPGVPDQPVVSMPDGSTWLFVKTIINSDVGPVSQILAIDATKEEALVHELNQSNQQLRDMNRRLIRYHEEVDDTVRSEELLEAKMRVHDKMGETLLAARMYLTNPDSPIDGEAVLRSWEQDLVLLREESKTDDGAKQVERFMDAAKHLGIELKLIGDIPENRDVMNLICVGIQECMTNAIQHAEATQMYVTIMRDEYAYTVDYSDNGKTPPYPIKEGGGLRLLRETAEKMDATMQYGEGRHFHLTLEIPRPANDQ